MPALLHHLTALEALARRPEGLPDEFARALEEDLEYARFGAALPTLPRFSGVRGAVSALVDTEGAETRREAAYRAVLRGDRAVDLGLKMGELVAAGALVGREPGLAFLSGYFSHLCLDRALAPLLHRLVEKHRDPSETVRAAERRIEGLWAALLARDGAQRQEEMAGSSEAVQRFKVQKRNGPPIFGVGRGLYELVRVSFQSVLDVELPKSELDHWVRGLWVYSRLYASPLGRLQRLPAQMNLSYRELYKGDDVDVPAATAASVEKTRSVLLKLHGLVERTRPSRRARERFFSELPARAAHSGSP